MTFTKKFSLYILFVICSWSFLSASILAEEKEKPLVTIGKETTVITEPLNAAGYPDYVAAIDKKYRERVNPERNAFITILRMTGAPEIIRGKKLDDESKYLAQFYKKLGMQPLPEKGRYLVNSSEFVKNIAVEELPAPNAAEEKIEDEKERIQAIRDRLEDEDFTIASERPWTAKEFPYVAKWLDQQEPILKQREELEVRDQFYVPYVALDNETDVISIQLPHAWNTRYIAYVLLARANLHLGNGDTEKAWHDCRTLMTLANHMYKLQTTVEMLIGKAIEGMATSTLLNNIIHDSRTTVAQLEKIQKEFEGFGQIDFARVLDQEERMSLLSAIVNCAEHGFSNKTLGVGEKVKSRAPYVPYWDKKLVHFDTLLKNANKDYDRLVEISKISNYIERTKAWDAFDSEVESDKKVVSESSWRAIGQHLFVEPRVRTEKVWMVFRCLYFPALGKVVKQQARQQMSRELYRCNFALAKFYKQHKKYPADFTELKAFGVSKLPTDIFTGDSCIYKSDDEGFLLYSLSADQEDSGGYNGRIDDSVYCDDVSVFSPNRLPKAPQ